MRIIHLQVCVVTHAVLLLAGERQSAERSGAAHIPDARQVVVVEPAVRGLVAHADNGEQPPCIARTMIIKNVGKSGSCMGSKLPIDAAPRSGTSRPRSSIRGWPVCGEEHKDCHVSVHQIDAQRAW